MSKALLGVVVALGGFAFVRAALAPVLCLRAPRPAASAVREVRALFMRAVAPTVAAAAVTLLLLVPAFVQFEPAAQGERAGLVLVVAAGAGLVQIAWMAARGAWMLLGARRLTRRWLRRATPLADGTWPLPATRIDTGMPVVALAGWRRPHLLVDRRVIETCTPVELAAIGAHERAHAVASDNARRWLVGVCCGWSSGTGRAWSRAAEQAADERAAETPERALALASALVKVARLAPAPVFTDAVLSTMHDGGEIEARVTRLLALGDAARGRPPAAPPHMETWRVAVTMAGGGAIAAASLGPVHALIELLVQRLP